MVKISMSEILKRCEADGDCQVWQFYVTSDGRPIWHHKVGAKPPVRRLVWELRNKQPMPAGRYACASCDTPRCVTHVQALTRSEQMLLASSRGRIGGPQHSANLAITRRRLSTKMTAEKVEQMKQRRDDGATFAQLAAEFGVHLSFAHRICNGGAWAAIGGASAFTYRP